MGTRTVRSVSPRASNDAPVELWTDPINTDTTTAGSVRVLDQGVVLNPSTRVLWRSADVVQLELGRRALVLEGVDSALIADLTGLTASTADASSGSGAQRPDAGRRGPARPGLEAAVAALSREGFLWHRPAAATPVAPTGPGLVGELAALRTRHGDRADYILARRRDATVVVHGTGRLPVALAALLAAANVGRVNLHDSGDVHRYDSAPGGLRTTDEGRRFNEAAHDALRRAAPDVNTRGLGPSDRADLVVLTGDAPVADELRSWLHRRATAHLVARTGADEAIVGPLVLPGLTSCLACADLTRLERDPAWSLLAVQLCTPRRYADPSDLALTNLTASLAALQALAYLDGDEPSVLSASLELQPPDWRVRRRTWAPHPGCDCEASSIDAPG
jgi:hypothetical protein